MFWKWGGACQTISLDDTERPAVTVKAKQDENGGLGACPQKNFLGLRPLERRETPFWDTGERRSRHLSLFSKGKLIPILETKYEYATLTHHFSILFLLSNARIKTSSKSAEGKVV